MNIGQTVACTHLPNHPCIWQRSTANLQTPPGNASPHLNKHYKAASRRYQCGKGGSTSHKRSATCRPSMAKRVLTSALAKWSLREKMSTLPTHVARGQYEYEPWRRYGQTCGETPRQRQAGCTRGMHKRSLERRFRGAHANPNDNVNGWTLRLELQPAPP